MPQPSEQSISQGQEFRRGKSKSLEKTYANATSEAGPELHKTDKTYKFAAVLDLHQS
jgi:hypothetical protein